MGASTIIKTLFDGSITLSDGTAPPVTLVVPYSPGDLCLSGLAATQKDVAKYETRGVLNSVRHTNRTYPSGSFSFRIADYSDATSQTVIDFVLKGGSFAANESTLGTGSEVYAVDVILTVTSPDSGESDHTITMSDCVCTMDVSEGEPNTGSINFEVLGSVTFA